MKTNLRSLLICCAAQLFIVSRTYAVYTYTWTGNTSTAWELSSNWTKTGTGTSTYPGQGGSTTDIVQIGVSSSYTKQPLLSSSATIASLTIGTKTNCTLTLNAALTVTGDITLQNNGGLGGITYNMTGSGSVSCTNFYLGDSTTPPLPFLGIGSPTFLTTLNYSLQSMTISQNLYLTTTAAKTSLVYLFVAFPAASVDNPVFNFNSGTVSVGNQVQTVDTNDANIAAYLLVFPAVSSSAQFLMAPTAGNSSTLNIGGANPISLDGNAGYVDLYGNSGGTTTVNYSGTTNQEVYTTSTSYSFTRQSPTGLDQTPKTYQYLTFSGSQTKKADAGNVNVANDMTLVSGTETVDFATNSPVVSVGGNFSSSTGTILTQGGTGTMTITGTSTNAGTINQTGSGNITFTGALNNSISTSVISQTGTGSIIASSGITNSGSITQGNGTIGSITITGALTNPGTITQTTGNVSVSTNLTNSGTLTLGSANLTVGGNYTNSGTYSQSTGTTLFNGSSAQTLQGGSGAGTLFKTVNFSGTGTKTMTSGIFAVASTSVLTMIGSSSLAANGYLTLNSDASGSATVAPLPSAASITGNVNVQRYLTGGSLSYRGYRLLSSPVTSGSSDYTINYIENSCYLTGTTGTAGGFDKTGNPTLYLYRENIAPQFTTFLNSNYRGINNLTTAPLYGMDDTTYTTANIPAGNGVLFFFRGDRNVASLSAETTTTYVPTSTTLTTTGALNTGTITVKDWYTPSSSYLGYTTTAGNTAVRGFNLVGNPYASSIDWDYYSATSSSAGIYAPHVAPTIYMLDPISHNYGVYVANTGGVGTNNATNIIASGQGFIVQDSTATGQLIFSEAAKTNSLPTGTNLLMTRHLASGNALPYLRLQLFKDTINNEDILIKFLSQASPNYSFNEDAKFLEGFGEVHMSSLSADSVQLAINTLPLPAQKPDVIRLFVSAEKSGLYRLNMIEMAGIPELYEVWLIDSYKKDSLNMRTNKTYAFNIKLSDTASYGVNRFKLVIRQSAAYAYRLLNFNAVATASAKKSLLTWQTANEGNYIRFTAQRSNDGGKTYGIVGFVPATGAGNYSLADPNPQRGENLYRLQQEDLTNTFIYSKPVNVLFGDSSLSSLSIYPNPVTTTINLSINAQAASYDIRLLDGSGKIIVQGKSAQSTWQTSSSSLQPGTYFIQVLNNKNQNLIGKIKFVKL